MTIWMKLNKAYWQKRYLEGRCGWNLGYVTPPIRTFIDSLPQKDFNILVPGAGQGYEAEYLFQAGFDQFTVLDIAPYPLESLQERLPKEFPAERLVVANFFDFSGGPFDLILEHTFFCALAPEFRSLYAKKMASLLREKGRLAGLLFDFPLTEDGPPYGGSKEEYITLFSPFFHIRILERSRNSVPARASSELFFIFEKK